MVTYEELREKYIAKDEAADKLSKEYQRISNKKREEAMKYYRLAAKKMGESNKFARKSNHATFGVSWIDDLLVPLLEEVNRRTGLDFETENLHTYGIFCECPVFTKSNDPLLSLVFTPSFGDDHTVYVKTGRKIDRYPIGSTGDINGGNDEEVEVTSVESVIENLRMRFPGVYIENRLEVDDDQGID